MSFRNPVKRFDLSVNTWFATGSPRTDAHSPWSLAGHDRVPAETKRDRTAEFSRISRREPPCGRSSSNPQV